MIENFNIVEYKEQLLKSQNIQDCPNVPLPYVSDNQNYIFISYSHKDYKSVYADLADMYDSGVRFWYDKGLSAGKKWDEEVTKKLLHPNCVGVIFFMSKNLFLSSSANREIEIVCNLVSDNEGSKRNINYFSVNLTEKGPIQILSETMQDALSSTLDMSMIGILSKAFPDNATYLYYNSPEHKKELINQIQDQFGVVSNPNKIITICKDSIPSSVFIGTLYGTLGRSSREKTIRKLCHKLEDIGIKTYIMQEDVLGYMDEDITAPLESFVHQQNMENFENAKCVILLCGVLDWRICAHALREFDPCAVHTKKIFYLIYSENYGDNETSFLKYYDAFMTTEQFNEISSRLFFEKDSEQKLINAVIEATKAE